MPKRYWFKRKLFGWGWQPATWEGWLSLFIFFFLELGNWMLRYEPRLEMLTDRDIYYFVAESIILVFLLILLCVQTGEKPRWQWGKRIEDEE